jgi:hypothetical protein
MNFLLICKGMSHRQILELSKALVAGVKKAIKYRKHLLTVDILTNIDLQIVLLENSIETKIHKPGDSIKRSW